METNFAQKMASVEVKIHLETHFKAIQYQSIINQMIKVEVYLGNRQSCKNVVMVSFFANLADLREEKK